MKSIQPHPTEPAAPGSTLTDEDGNRAAAILLGVGLAGLLLGGVIGVRIERAHHVSIVREIEASGPAAMCFGSSPALLIAGPPSWSWKPDGVEVGP